MQVSLGWSFLLAVLGWVVAAFALLTLIESAWSILTLLAVAVTLACLIRAPVEAFGRRMPRLVAVLLVVFGVVAVAGGVTANETWQLQRHADALADSIPERIAELDPDSNLRQFLEEAQVAERAQEVLQQIPQLVVFGTADQGESAQLGLNILLALILTVYAALNGPGVVRSLTGTITDPARRRLVHDSLRDGLDRAAAYVRRSLAWGVVSGLVATAVVVPLGLTGPSTLAVWAGVWSIVPVLGVVVGFGPIVLITALDAPDALWVVAAVGAVWWLLSLTVVDRVVAAPTVRVGPLLTTVALAFGVQFGWLVGSLVALFLTGSAAGFLSEVARRADPGGTPLDELTVDPAEGAGGEAVAAPAVVAPGSALAGGEPGGARSGGAGPGRAEPGGAEPGGGGSGRSGEAARPPLRLVWRSLDLRSGARATLLVVAALVGLDLLRTAQPGPTWILVGVIIGMALDPTARWVARRTRLPAGAAAAVVVGGSALALGAVLALAVPSLIDNLRQFDEQVARVTEDIEEIPLIGEELQRRGIPERLREEISQLPAQLAADPSPLTDVLRTAGDVLVGSFWTFLVAVASLVDGRRIARHARTLLPERHRHGGDEAVSLLYDTLVRYAAGSALVSGVVGLAVFATAAVLGIPLAPVLGLWALLWTFVPQIGGFMAAVPLVLLGLVEGTTDAILALAGYVIAWQVKNRILMPVIIGRAVNLSPVVAMTSVLVGGAAGGLVGAILATPLVGTARLAHRHFRPGEPAGRDDDLDPDRDDGDASEPDGPAGHPGAAGRGATFARHDPRQLAGPA